MPGIGRRFWGDWMDWNEAAALPYYPGEDLGAVWTPEHTVFKLWAPTAQRVTLRLFATGTDEEPDAALLGEHPMVSAGQGVWCAAVDGDLNGVY